nr:uncharacterized protein LOC105476221 isoform X6 [Macaca nemestrina]
MDGPEGQYAKGNKPVPRTLTDFPTRMWVIAQRSSVVMKESDSTAETPHSILRRVKWRNASEQTTHQGCGSCCYSEKEHLRGEKASRFLLRPDLYSMIRSQASWVRPSRKVNASSWKCLGHRTSCSKLFAAPSSAPGTSLELPACGFLETHVWHFLEARALYFPRL